MIQFYHIICSIQMERFYNSKWGGYMVTLTQKCREKGGKKTSFDAPYHFMRITVISRRRNNINNLIRIFFLQRIRSVKGALCLRLFAQGCRMCSYIIPYLQMGLFANVSLLGAQKWQIRALRVKTHGLKSLYFF